MIYRATKKYLKRERKIYQIFFHQVRHGIQIKEMKTR